MGWGRKEKEVGRNWLGSGVRRGETGIRERGGWERGSGEREGREKEGGVEEGR